MRGGAARFEVDARAQRADRGELFLLEPEAVHTGMAAVPEGWAYQVLYLDPAVLQEWHESDAPAPRAARWVVFRDPRLQDALARAHALIAEERDGLDVDEALLDALGALGPHLRPGAVPAADRLEHAAVRRARRHLDEHWDQPVPLGELARVARLSRFELVRRFHAQIGLTPHAYQLNLRIRHARVLLDRGHPAVEVALLCGYVDQAHFTRSFKRGVGTTPGRFIAARA